MKDTDIKELSKRGFFIGKTLAHDVVRGDIPKQATAMAYVTLLSLVPSLAVVFSLISIFQPLVGKGSSLIALAKDFILENLAPQSSGQAITYLDQFIANLDMTKIGITSSVGLLVTLIMLLKQIENALNHIWNVREPRNMITRFIYFWTFLTLGTFILSFLVAASSGFNLKSLVSLGEQIPYWQKIVSGITSWVLGGLFFTFLYKVVPNTFVSLKDATIGGAITSFLFQQASSLYGIYISNFTKYQSLYGALAALPIFLVWLYVLWIIILFGAVITWRIQQGFPKEEKTDAITLTQNPLEKVRNDHLKAILPVVIIMAVYRHFAEAKGTGLKRVDLLTSLKIPDAWLSDALQAAVEFGFIKGAIKGSQVTEDLAYSQEYFPSYPLESLKVLDLLKKLSNGTFEWLAHWTHDLPFDPHQILSSLLKLDAKQLEGMNLKELLS